MALTREGKATNTGGLDAGYCKGEGETDGQRQTVDTAMRTCQQGTQGNEERRASGNSGFEIFYSVSPTDQPNNLPLEIMVISYKPSF